MSAEVETERTENAYDFRAQEAKWRPYWEETGVFKPTGNAAKRSPLCARHVSVPLR